MSNNIEVEEIEIDGKNYIVLDEIVGKCKYVYLSNTTDDDDFIVRKISDDDKYLLSLDNEKELEQALLLYTDKHLKDL